jgi:TolB protein
VEGEVKYKKLKILILESCIIDVPADSEVRGYRKIINRRQRSLLEKIHEQMAKNLNFIELYDLSRRGDSCLDASSYMTRNGTQDISDYVFSKEFSDFDFVVALDIISESNDGLKLRAFLWNISKGHFAVGKYYSLASIEDEGDIYRLSNVISDLIFKETTGENIGLFDSRISYISETGKPGNRQKQVAIMNFDGTRNTIVSSSDGIKLTPVFSRYNQDEIYYLEYLREGPFIVRHNLRNGSLTRVSNGYSMTSSACCNPNTNVDQLVLACTGQDADTNLYLFDFKNNTNRKLTDSSGINISASFSPDGARIVFVSNRDGQKKLYTKDLKSGKEILISRSDGVYDKPSWSPSGKLIAFIGMAEGKFYLGVMTPEGNAIRHLMGSFLVEGVRWSPNSRYLIYTKQTSAFGLGSVPRIYIMDILTRREIMINTPPNVGASDPDWVMNQP